MKNTNSELIKTRREQMDNCQRIVCYRLRITPAEYIQQMYDCMHRYLKLRPGFADWPEVRDAVAGSPYFTTWWKNQWLNREVLFVNSIEKGDTLERLTESWQWIHNPRMLAGCIHPCSVVMEKAWPVVIGKVIGATINPPAGGKLAPMEMAGAAPCPLKGELKKEAAI